jgi:hypothetical protein
MRKLFLLFYFLPLMLQAQPYLDVASAYFQYSPGDKPPSDKYKSVNIEMGSVSLNVPLKVDSDYIVFNPTYENLKMDFSDTYNDNNFHIGYLPITWIHSWKQGKMKTAFGFVPRISSTLDTAIRTRDFQYEAYVLNILKKSDKFSIKFGIYYNTQYFKLLVIPLIGTEWQINERWSMFGVLPGSLNIDYRFTKSIHTGLQFRSITNNYQTMGYYYIRVNDYQLKLYSEYYITKRNVLTFQVGHTMFRKFRYAYRDKGYPEYTPMNITGGWLFKVGYAFRVSTEVRSVLPQHQEE